MKALISQIRSPRSMCLISLQSYKVWRTVDRFFIQKLTFNMRLHGVCTNFGLRLASA